MRNYDMIVIGGGPAGYHAAALGARQGLQVLLVEKNHLGGTCLNCGCIPTKSFCASAETADSIREAAAMGITLPGLESIRPDMQVIVARKDAIVASLREAVAAVVAGAVTVRGEASFLSPKTLLVHQKAEGESAESSIPGLAHRFRTEGADAIPHEGSDGQGGDYFLATAPKIIVATGSVPASLPVEGADLTLDSTGMLSLQSVPRSLAVIGGGVIGMEFASIFASLGSEVTVIEYCREILPPFDKDIAKRLRTALQRKGVRFHLGAQVTSVRQAEGVMKTVSFTAKGKAAEVSAESVLMAVGRRPLLPDGMEQGGYAVTPRGALVTDPRMETSVEGVYAVGDCNGICMLAHAASAQAGKVMGEDIDLSVIPSAVFTVPECAMAGLTEEEAINQGLDIAVGKSFFRANGKACAMGQTEGLVKTIVDKASGTLIGCHICGPHASDLIAEAALAIACLLYPSPSPRAKAG
ncbi:MAG: FAD-dependent oxidoreductase, partial [Muribaculaceae bacterium]|nr:FAD-dependent oxidoreductase [Muribaculaceae bacterium]